MSPSTPRSWLACAILLACDAEPTAPVDRAAPATLEPAVSEGGVNLLLITVDTLRADHLGCYGSPVAKTPNIDALARRGARFDQAYAHQPITLPSHASILTGTHPATHGVRDNGIFRLPDASVTLAEVLGPEGLETGAVVGARVLHRQYGLDQGFATYNDALDAAAAKTEGHYAEMGAEPVVDRALAWLDLHQDERFFLWTHLYDPHFPYQAPSPFIDQHEDGYDAEIAYVDHHVGRLLGRLEEQGLTERTLVVLTSDHGESLGEHGYRSHTLFVYDGIMRVPLILSQPGAIPTGLVVDAQAGLSDVAPTALELLAAPVPGATTGRSLVPLLQGRDLPKAPLVMATHATWYQHGWSPFRAVRHEGYKYIEAPRPELYKVDSDPGELEDRHAAEPERARALSELLRRTWDAQAAAAPSAAPAATPSGGLGAAELEQLAALGYLYDGTDQADPDLSKLTDPKDMLGVIDRTNDASTLRRQGKLAEAIALLEEVIQESPNDRRTLNRLGEWNARLKRFDEAERHLKRLLELEPTYRDGITNLGVVYLETERYDQADQMFARLVELSPAEPKNHFLRGEAIVRSDDPSAAIGHYERAVQLDPGYHVAWGALGKALLKKGDRAGAHAAYTRAARLEPDSKTYQKGLERSRPQ